MAELDQAQEKRENEKFRAKLLTNTAPIGGNLSDVVDIMQYKAKEQAEKRKANRERVEMLMLKNESGTATADEQQALKRFLQKRGARVIKR